MSHKAVWVKVNVQVDAGIADLISALSLFPALQTIESCQGEPAWICFRYGQGYSDLTEFICGYFGIGLARMVGDAATVLIRVTESEIIRGELSIRPGMITATTEAIKQLAHEYNGLRSAV